MRLLLLLLIFVLLIQANQAVMAFDTSLCLQSMSPLAPETLLINAYSSSQYNFATKRLIPGDGYLFLVKSDDGSIIHQSTLRNGGICGVAVDDSMVSVLFRNTKTDEATEYFLYSMDDKLEIIRKVKLPLRDPLFVMSVDDNVFIGTSSLILAVDDSGLKKVAESDDGWTIRDLRYDVVDSTKCFVVVEANNTNAESKITWINGLGKIVATYRSEGVVMSALHHDAVLYLLISMSGEDCPTASLVSVGEEAQTLAQLNGVLGKQIFIVDDRIYISGSRCSSGVYWGMSVWPVQMSGKVSPPVLVLDHNSSMCVENGFLYYFRDNELERIEL